MKPLLLPQLDLDDIWEMEEDDGWVALDRFARAVKKTLPEGAEVKMYPGYDQHELVASWDAGPSIAQLVHGLTRSLGSRPLGDALSFQDGTVKRAHEWERFILKTRRSLPSKAYGYAWMGVGLAGACARCGSENFKSVLAELLDRPEADRFESHPQLLALTHLGVDRDRIEVYAEALGTLLPKTSYEGGEEFHRRGHLNGLLPLMDTLLT